MKTLHFIIGVIILSFPAFWFYARNGQTNSKDHNVGDKVVVITGGSSGLGRELVHQFHNKGSKVAILDVNNKPPSTPPASAQTKYYKCDVSSRGDVEDVMSRITTELGPPDILINCAAAPINRLSFDALPPSSFAKTINANLLGPVHTIHALLPSFIHKETTTAIINVSSVMAHLYPGGMSDYVASKAGLSALHHCLAAEARWAGYDKHVGFFLVEIGQMDTPLFDWVKLPRVLAPVLRADRVARAILGAVESGSGGGVLRLPGYANWVALYVVMPGLVQRGVRCLVGFDQALAGSGEELG
ncbi:hypothetical protein BDW42DRAFT_198325 [Aspergillus taichungensis]|uniref:Ketoreductase domain-containing protein n=1 Tax=Aspergillus taichungensis TaxID=482145 RepID=A0A2J5I9W5_9EURO|nr:hypothetical protein BDW42DRAFT_198325 [Aspergillus taichungensis]